MVDRERFIERFLREVEDGNAAIFAGAGFSVAAGCVNWRELLREIADELGLNVDRETDLISVAQFHVNRQLGNRDQLNRAIIQEMSGSAGPTQNHRILSRLPINTWWTTNYDQVIEGALLEEERFPDVKHNVQQLAHTKPRRDSVVYKMHGDVDHPNDAVLTRDDYERYSKDRGPFLTSLFGDLVSKTFLFVGFSFSDPNLSKVLSHIRIHFEKGQRTHYAFFRKPTRPDFANDEDFEYEKAKQILVLEDLKLYNIQAILVDEYSEIDEIIAEIYRRFKSRYVFVSTSAYDYAPWGEAAVNAFMEKLGSLLLQRDMRLVTGVGLGTGNAMLGGAIVAISKDSQKKIEEALVLRPFPQFVDNPEVREKVWDDYRRDMIGRAGIAIFLFGNKLTSQGVVLALGMRKEFDIAREVNCVLLPIGATGSISRDLGADLLAHPEWTEIGVKGLELLKQLQEPVDDLDNILGPILDLIDLVRAGNPNPTP